MITIETLNDWAMNQDRETEFLMPTEQGMAPQVIKATPWLNLRDLFLGLQRVTWSHGNHQDLVEIILDLELGVSRPVYTYSYQDLLDEIVESADGIGAETIEELVEIANVK